MHGNIVITIPFAARGEEAANLILVQTLILSATKQMFMAGNDTCSNGKLEGRISTRESRNEGM